MSVTEAARLVGVHPNTLRAYADAGEIEYVRLPSGHRRFTREAVDAFRAAHRNEPRDVRPEDVEVEL